MQFLITAYDGKNKLEKRMEVRPRHIDDRIRPCDGILRQRTIGSISGRRTIRRGRCLGENRCFAHECSASGWPEGRKVESYPSFLSNHAG